MAIFIALVFVALLYLLDGVALYFLWGWYLVPLGIPSITLGHAIGIGVIVGFMTGQHIPRNGEDDQRDMMIHIIFSPLFALLVGGLVHVLFM